MQNTDEKTKSKSKRIIISVFAAVLILCTLFITFGEGFGMPGWSEIYAFVGVSEDLDAEFSACFLSVGTSDACLVKCRDKTLLVDTGLRLSYDKIYAFFRRHNITHIDAMVLSHADRDHIGGAAKVLDDFDVESVLMPQIPDEQIPDSVEYSEFQSSLKENNLSVIYPKTGSELKIGDMTLEFIMPEKSYGSINDNSLVFRLNYKNNSILFTGDISSKVEEDILNSDTELKSDILKVAHHGSKNSSCEEFLSAVAPKISVVSSGRSSSSLPDYTTMARIDKYSDELYCTAEDRTVAVTSDGSILTVRTGY